MCFLFPCVCFLPALLLVLFCLFFWTGLEGDFECCGALNC